MGFNREAYERERFNQRSKTYSDSNLRVMTLWSIFRSPLMFGGDLPSSDAWTLSLISNKEVLAVDQTSTNNRELFDHGDQIAWIADVPRSKDKYVALFNLNDTAIADISVDLKDLGFKGTKATVRDLWQGKELGGFTDKFSAKVNPHGAVLVRVTGK